MSELITINGQEEYHTENFTLARYLLAHGVEFQKIERKNLKLHKCTFIFTIPTSIDLNILLAEWDSPQTDYDRKLLFADKQLSAELKRFFESQEEIPPKA